MELKRIIEAILFSSSRPISSREFMKKLGEFPSVEVTEALQELMKEYNFSDRAVTIAEISGGYQMRTRQDYKEWAKRFVKEREVGLTRSTLETLSIIAYKQPISKKEIDYVRGVDSARAIKHLLEKRLIELGGREEDIGKSMVFKTSRLFLEVYGLMNITDLPTLKEIESLER
jgi:segregation and condensation protein B